MKPQHLRPHGLWVLFLLLSLACRSYGSKDTEGLVNNETVHPLLYNETDTSDDKNVDSKKDAINTDEVYTFYEAPAPPLPTDPSGKVIYPIIGVDGASLSTDATGVHLDENGEPFETNDAAIPLGRDGQPLPTNPIGQYIYQEPSTTKPTIYRITCIEPLPEEQSYEGPNPTDKNGNVKIFDGTPVPTNIHGEPVQPNGSPYPSDPRSVYDGFEQPLVNLLHPTNPSETDYTNENLLPQSVNAESLKSDEKPLPPIDSEENEQNPLHSFLEFFYNIHI